MTHSGNLALLTTHRRNAKWGLGRVLEVVEPGEGIVVVRGGIHEVGVLGMVEDVLDVDVGQEAETDGEAEGRGEVVQAQLRGNVRCLSLYSHRVHPSFLQLVRHLLSTK